MFGFTPLSARLGTFATILALLLTSAVTAQAVSRDDFRVGFSKGLELDDEKLMDRWMKKQQGATHAALYFEELCAEQMGGNVDNRPKIDALKQTWERCFEGSGTMRRLQRWVESMDRSTYDRLQRGRNQAARLWRGHLDMPDPNREELMTIAGQFAQLARNALSMGHKLEVAELYGLAFSVADKVKPDARTIEDRRESVRLREEFLAARDSWEFNFDSYYVGTKAYIKDEKVRIEVDEKKADKRRAEGYEGETRGVEGLVMPNVAAEKHALKYVALKSWDKELDYGPKNGKFPPLWWNVAVRENGTTSKLAWFQRRAIYFARTGGNKFAIALDPDNLKRAFPVRVSAKPKPSTFWLDEDKKVPYTMFFWVGSDRELVGLAECNLAPRSDFVLAYYRSGASWQAKVGKETVTLYDDNCNGTPGDTNVWELGLKINTTGDYDSDGAPAPHLDSMKVGRGKRGPASEFVKLQNGWFLVQAKATHVDVRPLNPEYFKTGKVKLKWNGPKSSAPSQLVIQGAGDYKTAMFDIAGGKEVEVPAGKWSVIFGRIALGKGSRVQNATLYQGSSEVFEVEEGKTKELVMGAPFRIEFERRGDKQASIDALRVFVQESSGCIFTELHGTGMAPEAVAAKSDDGKGAKVVGEFRQFTDGELVNTAGQTHTRLSTLCALFPMPEGYKSGALTLKVTMPSAGMKLGLRQKKHALFGTLEPVWK